MATLLLPCLAIILSISAVTSEPTPSESFPHYTDLVPDDKYHLFWKFDEKTITFEVHVKSKGYVGLGISPGGSMKGADIALGWVKDGKASLLDLHAEKNGRPEADQKVDWQLISGKETSNFTILKFRRKLVTCDKHDNDITSSTTRLIWAFSDDDPMSNLTDALKWHEANRGTKSMYLLEKPTVNRALPKDAFYIDFMNRNVTVPTEKTTYWGQGFKVEKLGLKKKHHIVKVEPIVTKGMESVVHHILLYNCDKALDDNVHGLSFNTRSSRGNTFLKDLMRCRGVVFGWAVGGTRITLPDEVGLPMGGSEDPGTYLMETHYDNPSRKTGLIDASGFRVWVTPTPRKYEGGIIQTGLTVSRLQVLPPHYPVFHSYGHCTKQCLSEALSSTPKGITVITAFLHSHLLGTAITLRHYRNGVELEPIMKDDFYDFNFQENRLVNPPRQILPGDNLVVDCTYRTTNRSDIAMGGVGTENEMCLAYITYYPKIQLKDCESILTLDQLYKFVGKINYETGQMQSGPYTGLRADKVFQTINWKDVSMRTKYQNGVIDGSIYLRCKKSAEKSWPSHRTMGTVPEITRPWKAPPSVCDASNPSVSTTPTSMANKSSGITAMQFLIGTFLWWLM